MKNKIIKNNLSGTEIVDCIRKGHMVRRSCWVDNFLIRVTNEEGYDSSGNVIYNKNVPLYTHATNGYFMHFASSSQPYKHKHYSRDGEGISMLFESDWEDWGFISSSEFEDLALEIKDSVRKEERKYRIALD